MGVIAIAANPNSGKDIRRLVTHATVIDNAEKVNILRRIVAGITALGKHEIWMMEDRYRLAARVLDGLSNTAGECVRVFPQRISDTQDDTTVFVEAMVHEKKADVIIVLGGDGTSRAAAKSIEDTPLLPVSTGTNNVYPVMIEGTAVAMAASAIADGLVSRQESGERGKRIEIAVGGRKKDIALIDAAVSILPYTGARAILHAEEIEAVIVTQCHPASIGFSALAGSLQIISPEQQGGLFIEPDWQRATHIAAISAGVMERFGVKRFESVNEGDPLHYQPHHGGTVAVDGERELTFHENEVISFTITRNGPRKVSVKQVVELAAQRGYLNGMVKKFD